MDVECNRIKVLGKGSFGTVYLADLVVGHYYHKPIAVKNSSMERANLLHRERIILKSLAGCRQVIQYIGRQITIENGHLMHNLMLEYAPCGSLGDLIRKGPLLESEVKVFTYMLLCGLCQIHQIGVIHCDLKPDNILLFPSSLRGVRYELKIADFGLSRIRGEKLKNDYDEFGVRIMKFRGTPFYMSPESITAHVDTPHDIWSLGCIVIEMMTGVSPWKNYKDLTKEGLMTRLIHREIPPIPHCCMRFNCRDFLEKCFEEDPEKRWTAERLLGHPFITGF